MKKLTSAICILCLGFAATAKGQGSPFRNLDFEQATRRPNPGNPYDEWQTDPAFAFPYWNVSAIPYGNRTNFGFYILWDMMTLDSPAIDLLDAQAQAHLRFDPPIAPLQGSYSVLLQGSWFFDVGVRLSQTGEIPAGTRSISFLLDPRWSVGRVTLNDVPIPLFQIGNRWWGDVTAFEGKTAELSLDGSMYFDDVQFSPLEVPEPLGVWIGAAGALLLRGRFKGHRAAKLPNEATALDAENALRHADASGPRQ